MRKSSHPLLSNVFEQANLREATSVALSGDRAPKLLKLRYYPDSILNRICYPIPEVTSKIRNLAKDMLLTMVTHGGIGLAGPQVGEPLCIIVVDLYWVKLGANKGNPLVFINPKITPQDFFSDKNKSREGCLSFPGITSSPILRHKKISVTATDLNGYSFSMDAEGLLSTTLQHEMDHLAGKTIPFSKVDILKIRDKVKKQVRLFR